MRIPENAKLLLERLNAAGYEAYAVGGCVRDTLLGRDPHDWDLCTSALPEQTMACFADLPVEGTGLRHGTVTVTLEGEPYEITTFRKDGTYTDHRRPDSVTFVTSLAEDLRRRDFTVNALACNARGEVTDLFGGLADLERRLLRCVGDPLVRFDEDALRMLRALRFSAQLDFMIEPDTAAALREKSGLLPLISGERVLSEMNRLLVAPDAVDVIRNYTDVFCVLFPEITPSVGFPHNNPCHYEDVWSHTLTAMSYSGPDLIVRWSLFLHDIGKPASHSLDKNGISHYKNHPVISRQLAEQILTRLHTDRRTRDQICFLVLYHDAWPPQSPSGLLRWINMYGEEALYRLAEVRRCDGKAHTDHAPMPTVRRATAQFRAGLDTILTSNLPRKVGDLAVSGRDLKRTLNLPNRELGRTLDYLLILVQDGKCENEPEALYAAARQQEEPNDQ